MRDPAPGRETVERGDCQRFLVGIAAVYPRFADSRSRGDSVDRHSLKPVRHQGLKRGVQYGFVDPWVTRAACRPRGARSEAHTSELQSLMRISYAVFCLKKQN